MISARERHDWLATLPDAGLRRLVGDALNIRPAERSVAVLRMLHCVPGFDQGAADWLAAWRAVHPEWSQVAH